MSTNLPTFIPSSHGMQKKKGRHSLRVIDKKNISKKKPQKNRKNNRQAVKHLNEMINSFIKFGTCRTCSGELTVGQSISTGLCTTCAKQDPFDNQF